MFSEGAFIASPPFYWPDIFSCVYWAEEENPAADRCGKDLLYFIFMLGDAVQRSDGAQVPEGRAIEMMLECWLDSTSYLVFRSEGARRWIETTALGADKFGVSICVDMPKIKNMLADYLWNMDVPYE